MGAQKTPGGKRKVMLQFNSQCILIPSSSNKDTLKLSNSNDFSHPSVDAQDMLRKGESDDINNQKVSEISTSH